MEFRGGKQLRGTEDVKDEIHYFSPPHRQVDLKEASLFLLLKKDKTVTKTSKDPQIKKSVKKKVSKMVLLISRWLLSEVHLLHLSHTLRFATPPFLAVITTID